MPIAQQESLVREAERDNIVGGSAASGLEEFLQVKPELYEGPLGIGTKGDEPFPIRVSVVQAALRGTTADAVSKIVARRPLKACCTCGQFPDTVCEGMYV